MEWNGRALQVDVAVKRKVSTYNLLQVIIEGKVNFNNTITN